MNFSEKEEFSQEGKKSIEKEFKDFFGITEVKLVL